MTSEKNDTTKLRQALARRLDPMMPTTDDWQRTVIATMAERRRRRHKMRRIVMTSAAAAAIAAIVFIPAIIGRADTTPEDYIFSDDYYSSLPERTMDISVEIDSIFRILDAQQ